MTGWIKCSDRLPEHMQFVLGLDATGCMSVLRVDISQQGKSYCFMWPDLRFQVPNITHWMPLPNPPEGE